MRNIILLLVTLFIANPAFAQYEADTESIQSTIDALYEVISGDAGVEEIGIDSKTYLLMMQS